tara:strand:+ start:66 stop:260 length:195 start_codon:yes stop_codon:yes gene_type:complete
MKYKYNISYKEDGKKTSINFNSKNGMIEYLNNNIVKVNSLASVYINFNQVSLPIKTTIWSNKKK